MLTLSETQPQKQMMSLFQKKETAPPTPEQIAYREAKKTANRRVAFFGHLVAWAFTNLFLLTVAGFEAAAIVGMAWGIGLAIQGFYAIFAPELRKRWIDVEVQNLLQGAVTTERRQLQDRHARSLEELSASIAHEIRNPITAAKSLVQQMGEDPASDENVEYARIAIEELDRVERSISHLLRYARDEEVRIEDIEIQDVVESALETFRDRLDRGKVQIETDFSGDGRMRGDSEKLRRVLINLVGNALDELEALGVGGTIRISSGKNLAGSELWLKVKDDGPGIDPGRLSKIFSPFYTSKDTGTGLGLAICKKLVEAHGGTIEVQSELGVGTEFVLTFKLARSEVKQ
jgi:signal transduction histidine kinase